MKCYKVTMSTVQTNLGSVYLNFTRFTLNWITRQVLAGVLIYSVWPALVHYNYWFSWHVIFCTLGYIPLMAEAIMIFTGDEIWTRQLDRQTKNFIHGCLITVATITLSIGVFILTYYTERCHFCTPHGLTGFISTVLALISIIIGYATNYAQKLSSYCKPIWIKAIHNLLGLLCYIIGIISLCYAYYTHWFVYWTTAESRIVALVATILFSFWPLNGAIVSGYNQLKTIIKS